MIDEYCKTIDVNKMKNGACVAGDDAIKTKLAAIVRAFRPACATLLKKLANLGPEPN